MPIDGLADAVQQLPLPWHGHYVEATDSTQDEARSAARAGAPSRSILVADYQRAGRGRQGRAWLASPGVALMMSVVFREDSPTATPFRWTSLASVALAEAIELVVPALRAAIKWPNDVLIANRKAAGILAETAWDGQQLLAIVGVGVNVRTDEAELAQVGGPPTGPGRLPGLPSRPAEDAAGGQAEPRAGRPAWPATSLRVASGQDVDRGRLLLAFVDRVDAWLERPPTELHRAWQTRLWGRGQRLRLLDLGREEEVVVLGAEPDGFLHVRLPDGTERLTTTGELLL